MPSKQSLQSKRGESHSTDDKFKWAVNGFVIGLLISTALGFQVIATKNGKNSATPSPLPTVSFTSIEPSDREFELKQKEYNLKENSQNFAQDIEAKKVLQGWFTLLATSAAGIGLWANYWRELQKFREEKKLTQQRLTNERFTKAIEQLAGKETADIKDDITIRVGGIYALQGIEKDSPEMSEMIMTTLASYVRRHSEITDTLNDIFKSISVEEYDRLPLGTQSLYVNTSSTSCQLNDIEKQNRLNALPNLRADIMTAIVVLGKLKHRDPRGRQIDLHGADLRGSILVEANLSSAWLVGANLSEAILYRAILTNAYLSGGILMNADLTEANLTGANLSKADVTGVNLTGAHLSEANVTGANLTGATYNTQPVTIDGLNKPINPTEFPAELDNKAKRDARGMVEKNSPP